MYVPNPMDTKGVELPGEIRALKERLAENVHDVWAAGRISEGWSYGAKADPKEKKTPLLVPYAELPEREKDYDRNTAAETLKVILELGYRIAKPGADDTGIITETEKAVKENGV